MGYLRASDFTPNMRQQAHDPRRLQAQRLNGLRGLAGKGSRAAAAQGAEARSRGDALGRQGTALLVSLRAYVPTMVRKADAAVAGADATQDSEAMDAAQSLLDMANDASTRVSDAATAFNDAQSAFEAKYLAATRGQGMVNASTADDLQAAVDDLKKAQVDLGTFDAKVASVVSQVRRIGARVQAERATQGAAQSAAQQAAALQASQLAAQQAREDREEARRAALEEAQRQRETAAEARREAAEQQARQESAQARADAIAREDALTARQEAAEAAKQAASEARQQAVLAAEDRKAAMAQEAEIRREEAQLRREEREAELQRLMTMQELAAKGLPSLFSPPGADAYGPTVPGAAFSMPPGYPAGGVPGAPSGYPGGYPGMPQGPYPGLPAPGYAATPPQAPAAPPAWGTPPSAAQPTQGPLPEGMAWSSLSPGNELFGMGGMGAFVPTNNLRFRGAQLEQGYVLRGPARDGTYSILAPQGRQGLQNLSESDLSGPLADMETGDMIYQPPPAASGGVTGQDVAAIISESIRGGTAVMAERERAKAARYAARGQPPVQYDQGQGYGQGPPPQQGGGYGGLVFVGALGLGALAIAAAVSSKKKSTKNAKA
jgi:chemotaxis protein histidine kinase CheA